MSVSDDTSKKLDVSELTLEVESDTEQDANIFPEHTRDNLQRHSQHDDTLYKMLFELKLDDSYWPELLNNKLGIETSQALSDFGRQAYPFLMQFVREPKERKALRMLLHMGDKHDLFSVGKFEWQKLLDVQVRTLKKFECEEKTRKDEEVNKVEDRLRKMLIVSENDWISKEMPLQDAIFAAEKMVASIGQTISDGGNLDENSFIAQKVSDVLLKGITNTGGILVKENILRLPEDLSIHFPVRAQWCEQIHFESKTNEVEFLEQVSIFGCSLLNKDCSDVLMESTRRDEGYCSTVKYCFIPMASCSLEDHKILLSDDAIFQLQKIEKMGATQIEENCRKFFSRFGSHSLTGPLHFGGIFIWKCHSFGYVDSEKEQIRKLQDDAISASSAMLFPNEKKVSLLEDTSLDNYLQKLKDRTYIQTITIGGPSTMLGFPDWKYILTKCNKTWELIDHGLTQIAVWDVIIMNHAKDFNSSECLAKELKTQWARQASTKLNEIQSLHEEVQRNVLSVVVEEIPLKMQCNDFDSVRHFFKIALEVITSKPQSEVVTITDRIIHPQKAVRATLIVERAVHLLRNNLLKTKQNMIDCLLLTILNPLEYCPKKKIFPILLARSDIEYLYNNSKSIYEEFVRVQRQKSDLKTQSYIFYQATFLCDMLGVSIACLESHIEYLKNKIKQLSPNILTCLQALQTDQSCRKWNTFQAKMELFKNSEAYAREDKSGLCPVSVVEHHAPTQHMEQRIKKLFISLGLDEFFPQQLSLFHALQIRENLSGNHDPRLHPFIMLQKIMLFDPKCRMGVSGKGAKIHPMDALLALLHCSDNFLRQDIFSRFAACQFAVPLLLPHPYAREPTLLLWAMRSIVKECLSDAASDRIVKFPTAFVSFCRLGNPKVSLSEILNGVVKAEHDMFLNSNGAILSKGLVELSWRLQSLHSGSVPTLIAYANFHGDICDTDCKRQINFLCKISSVYVVLIENTMLEDANLECTVEVLKNLSGANRKVILVPSEDQEGIKNQLPDECQGVKWIDYDRSIKGLSKSIRKKVKKELKKSSCHYPLADLKDLTHSCCINIDEDMDDCVKGTDLAKRIFDMVKTPRQVLLPLQSDDLWTKWAKLDKEQYRQKKRDISSMKSVEGGWQYLQIPMNMHEYSEWLQTQKLKIRKRQFDLAREKNTFMSSFVNILKDEGDNGNLLSYFMLSLRMELDDLSRNQPSYYKDQTREINDQQAAKNSGELLNVLEMQIIDNRIGLREMSQMYESFIEQKKSLCAGTQIPMSLTLLLNFCTKASRLRSMMEMHLICHKNGYLLYLTAYMTS